MKKPHKSRYTKVLESFDINSKEFLCSLGLLEPYEGALFFSGEGHSSSKASYLALFPYEEISVTDGKTVFKSLFGKKEIKTGNPWDNIREFIGVAEGELGLPDWLGYFSYEMGAHSEPGYVLSLELSDYPLAQFKRFAALIKFEIETTKTSFYFDEKIIAKMGQPTLEASEGLLKASFWKKETLESIKSHVSLKCIQNFDSLKDYTKKIEDIKELIKEGVVYQLNLSHRAQYLGDISPAALFERLSLTQSVPFSAYLRFDHLNIISFSPERLLKNEKGKLSTCPIKGTAPRGLSEEEDQANKKWLLESEKNFSELLMITDLSRNDLSKVSEKASVQAKRIACLEAYQNVFHLVSEIESLANPRFHAVDLIRACFPGGSITGCPKLSAMQELAKLEKRARGIYTGSIGYLAENGDFDFNIAIRTLTYFNSILELSVGGGIVIDSDPAEEYEETFHKGAPFIRILNKCIS